MLVALIVTGLLLLAHGLVHLLYVTPDVPEFSLERSWLVPESARRPLGLVLLAATVVAFAGLALAVWGLPGLAGAWPAIAIGAGLLSAALLGLFWNRSLGFGLAIDVAILAIAVLRPSWVQDLLN